MTPRRSARVAILAVVLAGACLLGADFGRPDPASFTLGQTTEQEIRTRFGQPSGQTNARVGDKVVTTLRYAYAEARTVAVPVRIMAYAFHEGRLVGFDYMSSFAADQTLFDELAVKRITRGVSTRAEVLALMGKPAGQFIYPSAFVATPGHHAPAPRRPLVSTPTLRSHNWFGKKDLDGFAHRSWIKAEGFSELMFDGRPVIGIANSWSELTNCNAHLRQVAEAVKRGVLSAGGFPLEFPTISLGEILMKPTTMLFRNLMAMDVEECIRAYPLDGVVLLSGCDKTTPAMLMGAASADLPAIMVTGGPMLRGRWRTEDIGSGTDNWRFWAERRQDGSARRSSARSRRASRARPGTAW